MTRSSKARATDFSPAEQVEVRSARDRARVVAILIALAVLLLPTIVVIVVLNDDDSSRHARITNGVTTVGISAAALLMLGVIGRWRARFLDDRNYMIQKATPMPLRLVNDHDDIWTEGRLVVPRPAIAPHFGEACAYFSYREEERRGSGKEAKWVTVASSTRYAHAWLQQERDAVRLDLPKALFDGLSSRSSSGGNRRHSLTWLPAAGRISAAGLVVEDGGNAAPPASGGTQARLSDARGKLTPGLAGSTDRQQRTVARKERRATSRGGFFGRLLSGGDGDTDSATDLDELAREVLADDPSSDPATPRRKRWLMTKHASMPLLVTTRRRPEWYDRAEAGEIHWRTSATIFLWVALCAGAWWAGVQAGWLSPTGVGSVLASLCVGSAAVLPLIVIGAYNRFVACRIRVTNAWAQIDVDLKQRHDLIPRLVETCKGYASYEAGLLEKIARSRTDATILRKRLAQEADLGEASAQLTALVESYPELKANALYSRLQRELVAIEEKIAHGRVFFNDTVREFNTLIESFPDNLLARMVGLSPFPYFSSK